MLDRQRFEVASEAVEGWARALVGLRNLLTDQSESGDDLSAAATKLFVDLGIQDHVRKTLTRRGRIEIAREWADTLRKEMAESAECLLAADSELTAVTDGVITRTHSSGTSTYDNAHQAILSQVPFVLLFIDGFSKRLETLDESSEQVRQELLSLIERITFTADEASNLQSRVRRERARIVSTMHVARLETEALSPAIAKIQTSPDYRSMRWGDSTFVFTPKQAACIRVLFEAWKSGSPVVGQDCLLEAAESEGKRLRDIFKGSDAWKKAIISVRKGSFRLADPE